MSQAGGPTLIPGIAEAICDRILRGQLKEGEVIPQTELAKELGVSPVPLREALRRLEAEGLVTFLPYRGTIVAPITEAEIREGFAAAIALGQIMLREAVPKLKPGDFEALEALAELLDGGDAAIDDVLQFYTLLLQPAGMPWLLDMVRKIILRCIRFFPATQANRRALQHVKPTRLELVAAFRTGDRDAAARVFADYHQIRREGLVKAHAQRDWKP
ncbi:MAG TPA: GntR family transcriptional regulator [Holophagaceae bacterium]|nr:GntR family transcriptional regulator [Holophagaceae bacterium]